MAQNIVIIGAVALGPKAACRLKRLKPEADVVMIDQNRLISYGGCGIPYLISGDVSDPTQLQTTSFHMVRDEKYFREAKDIKVRTQTRALEINRRDKKVLAHDLKNDKKYELPYDRLVLATGSTPRYIDIPGQELPGAFTVSGLEEAVRIREQVTAGKVGRAVVIGAGFIGLEMAEALADMWGIETTVVEIADQVLPGFISPSLARITQKHMHEQGVDFFLQEKVHSLTGKGKVQKVITERREIETDLVVMATGVTPNGELARQAGLAVSEQGGIIVDKTMRTSDRDIFAGGDCVKVENLVTGSPGYFPMGSLANRQGRVIGTNLADGSDTFPGSVGSFVVKTFEQTVAGTGLSLKAAQEAGFQALSAQVIQFDHSHFYPEKDLVLLELVAEKNTGRVLGIQGISSNGHSLKGRIDAVAAFLPYKPTTREISNLELAYSPPFASAMDVLNATANTAENKIAGLNQSISSEEFSRLWARKENENIVFLDCRSPDNAASFVEKYPGFWQNISTEELREKISQVPEARELILVCNTGGRSYEAQLILADNGITNTRNLEGGIGVLKRWGLEL
ncbi:MAG: FAD-dependent oxidoreductase [Desulfonatronovibrionaceae bacterium]